MIFDIPLYLESQIRIPYPYDTLVFRYPYYLLNTLNRLENTATVSSEPDSILQSCSTADLATLSEHLRNNSASPETIQKLVTEAWKSKHLDITQYLLTTYPHIAFSEDATCHSVYSGSIALFTVVLTKDPSTANMDSDKRGTPLAIALMSRQPLPYIAFLLKSGADPNKDLDILPSHLALAAKQYHSADVVALLLQHVANVAHTGVLLAATRAGNVEMVKVIVEARSETEYRCA